jgi:hypothetical protein
LEATSPLPGKMFPQRPRERLPFKKVTIQQQAGDLKSWRRSGRRYPLT